MRFILQVAAMIGLSTSVALGATQFTENSGEIKRVEIPNQFILSYKTSSKVQSMSQFAASIDQPAILFSSMESRDQAKVLLSRKVRGEFKTSVLINKSQMDAYSWQQLRGNRQFLSISPNYLYKGDFREGFEQPNDPQIADQYFHEKMGNIQLWPLLDLSRKVVVAVTDDGVDIDHEDLKENIYTNKNEIPGNGIDDDGNGYTDDTQGWDFADQDKDVRPGAIGSHGTHVAGIVGATLDNGIGVAGTAAPIVEIMPLRFFNYSGFTSAVVAETFRYAADNGADIVTTSYNIDQFVGDLVYEEAIAYVYDAGLIHFNSAGNGYSADPRRRVFEELILVCSTDDQDKKSGFSNYGEGIDVCAPGSNILSTLPDNEYGSMGGTSMATPNAAASAAVIWSQNPTWTRDQVVASLLGNADNLDAENPNYIDQLGAGRVNTFRAVTEELTAPSLQKIIEVEGGTFVGGQGLLSLRFDKRLDPNSVRDDQFVLSGPNGFVEVKLERPYKIGSGYVVLDTGVLPVGDYVLTLENGLKSPFGKTVEGTKTVGFAVTQ